MACCEHQGPQTKTVTYNLLCCMLCMVFPPYFLQDAWVTIAWRAGNTKTMHGMVMSTIAALTSHTVPAIFPAGQLPVLVSHCADCHNAVPPFTLQDAWVTAAWRAGNIKTANITMAVLKSEQVPHFCMQGSWATIP